MDFISYLDVNDAKIFGAFCVLFRSQIESAMGMSRDEPYVFRSTCSAARRTQLILEVTPLTLGHIRFSCKGAGRKFDLVGRVDREAEDGIFQHHGWVYHYRPEHSRLLRDRDFDDTVLVDDVAYNKALARHTLEVQRENDALSKWWEEIQEKEILERLRL